MNLSARNTLVIAVAVVVSSWGNVLAVGGLVALSSCGGRGGGTGGGSGGGTGTGGGNCAPFCAGTGGGSGTGGGTAGSGTGGGTAGSGTGGGTAGSGTGGGTAGSGTGGNNSTGQIAYAKRDAGFCNTLVGLRGVRVTAVESQFLGTAGDGRSSFWVAEPSNPNNGLYVFKDYTDTINGVTDGGVSVGDTVNIDGFMSSLFPDFGAEAYRYELRKGCSGNTTGMQIVTTGTGALLADVQAPTPFGLNPDGGRPKGYFVSDQRFITPTPGARVHVPGPLTLSNAFPVEMIRANDTPQGVVFGFEVSGAAVPAGMLVRNNQTFRLSDGGASNGTGEPACDYRQLVADGGRMVTFPNGISGVWDTFSQSPCYNGMTSCTGFNTRDAGYVPGLGAKYTFVLEPLRCSDLAGAVVTP